MVRWSFILALIPAVVFAIAGMAASAIKKPPAPIAVKAPPIDIGPRVVKTESITTFDGRWPFAAPPPAIEQEIRPVARERDVVGAVSGAVETAPQPVKPSRHRRLKTKRARLDICRAHGMHKQITRGGKSWRCRR